MVLDTSLLNTHQYKVQFKVASYQRLLRWYLIPPYLTLINIRYLPRVKWSNPEKDVAPSPTTWCSSYWKGSLLIALDYGRQQLILKLMIKKQRSRFCGDKKSKWVRISPRAYQIFSPIEIWLKRIVVIKSNLY